VDDRLVTETTLSDRIVIIRVSGEVDHWTCHVLADAIEPHIEEDRR
jgi:hypothetical protein